MQPNKDNKFSLGSQRRRWINISTSNGVINTSDIREKYDVKTLEKYGIKDILKMRPVEFQWNEENQRRKGKKELGFIAQELNETLPETITCAKDTPIPEKTDETDEEYKELLEEYEYNRMGIYSHMILPVLVKGIKDFYSEYNTSKIDQLNMLKRFLKPIEKSQETIIDETILLKKQLKMMELTIENVDTLIRKYEKNHNEEKEEMKKEIIDLKKRLKDLEKRDVKSVQSIMKKTGKEVRFNIPLPEDYSSDDQEELSPRTIQNLKYYVRNKITQKNQSEYLKNEEDDFIEFEKRELIDEESDDDTTSSNDSVLIHSESNESLNIDLEEMNEDDILKDTEKKTSLKKNALEKYYEKRDNILNSVAKNGERKYIGKVKELRKLFEK